MDTVIETVYYFEVVRLGYYADALRSLIGIMQIYYNDNNSVDTQLRASFASKVWGVVSALNTLMHVYNTKLDRDSAKEDVYNALYALEEEFCNAKIVSEYACAIDTLKTHLSRIIDCMDKTLGDTNDAGTALYNLRNADPTLHF